MNVRTEPSVVGRSPADRVRRGLLDSPLTRRSNSVPFLSRFPRSFARCATVWCLVATAAVGGAAVGGEDAAPGAASDSLDAPAAARELVQNYCLDCHSAGAAEAGFELDAISMNLGDPSVAAAWTKALTRIERGEMPPADYGALPDGEGDAAIAELRSALTAAAVRRQEVSGRAELRRLSREEYANALKDVLGLPHLDVVGMLPPDGIEHGFAKTAGALDFSHVSVGRLPQVADAALRAALADRIRPLPRERIRGELKSVEGVKKTLQTLFIQLKGENAIPLVGTEIDPTFEGSKKPSYARDDEPKFDGVVTFMNGRSNHDIRIKPFRVPQDGEYFIRVAGWGVRVVDGKLAPTDKAGVASFYGEGGRLLGRCDLPPNEPGVGECRVWLREGERVEFLAASPPNQFANGGTGNGPPRWERTGKEGVALRWFELDGPLPPRSDDPGAPAWPPESHRRLFGDLPLAPLEGADADRTVARAPRRNTNSERVLDPESGLPYRVVSRNPRVDAARLLRDFADRALRRPATNADLAVPTAQIKAALADDQPFAEAMLSGYRALLTSPAFLLRLEGPGRLDGYETASRLALFLWDGPPDEELKAAAASGALLTDDDLRRQTERMLDDPRADRFVARFLDRWLDLEDLRLTEPDSNLYPENTDFLVDSMLGEPRAFFRAMLADDLSVSHVYDSDFLTINQPLAELYGIDGVVGSAMQRTPIPADHVRGGLLTQAAVLKVTANGTTTSPVVRGVFVMDRLLGDPPPPPPPNVPAIEPDLAGATTVRELLNAHRADPACAGCHTKIDPPGFALESFDVMGGYRERYRVLRENSERRKNEPVYQFGPAVDPHGDLPAAGAFADVNEFRDRLRGLDRQIADNLLRRLTVYATGAPVSLADEAEFESVLDALQPRNYGLRSMIHAVVQSDMFRRK